MTSLFEGMGAQYVDHFAVTTRDLMATLNDWLAIPGSRLLRGPARNVAQKVLYAFVQLEGRANVEILAPMGEDSPIVSHLNGSGGAYHFCFAVTDLDAAILFAVSNQAKVVVSPLQDVAFDGRRIAFLFHPVHGLFEIVEAKCLIMNVSESHELKDESVAFPLSNQLSPASILVNQDGIYLRVKEILFDCFPESINLEEAKLEMNCVPEWSSLGQLNLMIQLENEFSINIPVDKIMSLINFLDIVDYISCLKLV